MKALDRLKDISIVYSFDSTGYQRHARGFQPIDDSVFRSKRYLITGGTSGIGAALAERLVRAGAQVKVTGRNLEKFEQSALAKLNVEFLELDMADFNAVMTTQLSEIDGLICNAGGMPEKLHVIDGCYDLIFASQVIGHYLLIRRCIEQELLPAGSSIHLTSSGGMYLQKLELTDLCWRKTAYDKVRSYANAKRAQVILNQELPRFHPNFTFSCSHPGWVGTDALKEALPWFSGKIGKRLRSVEEGADTIYWCLAQGNQLDNGEFWFDRKARHTYPFCWTRESAADRLILLDLCQQAWGEASGKYETSDLMSLNVD